MRGTADSNKASSNGKMSNNNDDNSNDDDVEMKDAEGGDDDDDDDEGDDDDEYEDVYVNVVFPPKSSAFDSATDPISASNATAKQGLSNELQESIDYKNEAGVSTSVNKLRVSGWSEERPLFQNKQSVLLGQWQKLVGSELVFDENGEYVTTIDGHLTLEHGRMLSSKTDTRPLVERARSLALEISNEMTESSSDQPVQSEHPERTD